MRARSVGGGHHRAQTEQLESQLKMMQHDHILTSKVEMHQHDQHHQVGRKLNLGKMKQLKFNEGYARNASYITCYIL